MNTCICCLYMVLHAKTHCSVVGMKCNNCITSTEYIGKVQFTDSLTELYVIFSPFFFYLIIL